MRFADCTYQELSTYARRGAPVVIPTGCTEQQGPHLPVDLDTWLVETICQAAAERVTEQYGLPVLVLPALPVGPTPEHRHYGSGYIHLPQELHEAVVEAVLRSLAEQGFARLIIWRGCGQHQLDQVVELFNATHTGRARAFLPAHPYGEIWDRVGDPAVATGHADSFATSIALYLRPEAVRTDRIPPPELAEVDWSDPNLDFSSYSHSGVIGDATQASAQLGEKLWKEVVERVAQIFYESLSICSGEVEPLRAPARRIGGRRVSRSN